MQISRRMIQRLTRSKGILHNRRPAYLKRRVRPADTISARIATAEGPTLEPVAMELSIRYEDVDLLVVDKPPGLLVHPTSGRHDRTLAHGIAHYLTEHGTGGRVHPVHRIDRDTSGLVVIAKSSFAHQHLDRQLRTGDLKREYLAVVEGVVEGDGAVSAPIGRMPGKPHLRRVVSGGQAAHTTYGVEKRLARSTLLRVELDTGRTHQIRVHLSHIGHPLVGDRLYGAKGDPAFPRYALHSWRLSFTPPRSGEAVVVEAPLPSDLQRLLAGEGGDGAE